MQCSVDENMSVQESLFELLCSQRGSAVETPGTLFPARQAVSHVVRRGPTLPRLTAHTLAHLQGQGPFPKLCSLPNIIVESFEAEESLVDLQTLQFGQRFGVGTYGSSHK